MKHKLSACALIPTLAVLYLAKVKIKMHDSVLVSELFCSPTNTENFNIFIHITTFHAIHY